MRRLLFLLLLLFVINIVNAVTYSTTYKGTVKYNDKVLSGATVTISCVNSGDKVVTTDEEGEFSVEVKANYYHELEDPCCTIGITHPDYTGTWYKNYAINMKGDTTNLGVIDVSTRDMYSYVLVPKQTHFTGSSPVGSTISVTCTETVHYLFSTYEITTASVTGSSDGDYDIVVNTKDIGDECIVTSLMNGMSQSVTLTHSSIKNDYYSVSHDFFTNFVLITLPSGFTGTINYDDESSNSCSSNVCAVNKNKNGVINYHDGNGNTGSYSFNGVNSDLTLSSASVDINGYAPINSEITANCGNTQLTAETGDSVDFSIKSVILYSGDEPTECILSLNDDEVTAGLTSSNVVFPITVSVSVVDENNQPVTSTISVSQSDYDASCKSGSCSVKPGSTFTLSITSGSASFSKDYSFNSDGSITLNYYNVNINGVSNAGATITGCGLSAIAGSDGSFVMSGSFISESMTNYCDLTVNANGYERTLNSVSLSASNIDARAYLTISGAISVDIGSLTSIEFSGADCSQSNLNYNCIVGYGSSGSIIIKSDAYDDAIIDFTNIVDDLTSDVSLNRKRVSINVIVNSDDNASPQLSIDSGSCTGSSCSAYYGLPFNLQVIVGSASTTYSDSLTADTTITLYHYNINIHGSTISGATITGCGLSATANSDGEFSLTGDYLSPISSDGCELTASLTGYDSFTTHSSFINDSADMPLYMIYSLEVKAEDYYTHNELSGFTVKAWTDSTIYSTSNPLVLNSKFVPDKINITVSLNGYFSETITDYSINSESVAVSLKPRAVAYFNHPVNISVINTKKTQSILDDELLFVNLSSNSDGVVSIPVPDNTEFLINVTDPLYKNIVLGPFTAVGETKFIGSPSDRINLELSHDLNPSKAPVVDSIVFNPSSPSVSDVINVSISASDVNGGNDDITACYLRIDDSLQEYLMSGDYGSSIINAYLLIGPLTSGSHSVSVYCKDDVNGFGLRRESQVIVGASDSGNNNDDNESSENESVNSIEELSELTTKYELLAKSGLVNDELTQLFIKASDNPTDSNLNLLNNALPLMTINGTIDLSSVESDSISIARAVTTILGESYSDNVLSSIISKPLFKRSAYRFTLNGVNKTIITLRVYSDVDNPDAVIADFVPAKSLAPNSIAFSDGSITYFRGVRSGYNVFEYVVDGWFDEASDPILIDLSSANGFMGVWNSITGFSVSGLFSVIGLIIGLLLIVLFLFKHYRH